MRIIFCNIAYMKRYCGDEDDIIVNGGKYIAENNYGGEVCNFLDYDGKCYGYFMHYGDVLHIERIENTSLSDDVAEDVLVVWVAKHDKKNSRSVIVGWYRHADVYRYVIDGDYHNIVAGSENCHLLPEDKRNFEIPRASINGKGKGMGQSAIWYADSEYAKNEFVPKVWKYIEDYEKNDGEFINKVWTDEIVNQKYTGNMSDNELTLNTLRSFGENDIEKSFSFVNASIENGLTRSNVQFKAMLLYGVNQFTRAVPYFEKALEFGNLDGVARLDFLIEFDLFNVYMLANQLEKAVDMGKFLKNHRLYSSYDDDEKIRFNEQMIEMLMTLGREDEAEEYHKERRMLYGDSEFYFEIL